MVKLVAIGSDPEVFLFKKGNPVSAVGLVPGTKKKPHMITEHESVQLDNVALEFGVKPTLNPEEFAQSLKVCYQFMAEHLSKIDPDLEIVFKPSAEFDPKELMTRAARRFGCERDHNAWTMDVNTPPDASKVGNLRSCGGHIHLGVEGTIEDPNRLIRLLDFKVGLYMNKICKDQKRRELYGKAGAYRIKPYGIEYRTPSNTWLTSMEYINDVFELVKESVNMYNEWEDAPMGIEEIINEGKILEEL